jgi:glucose-1-phosphate adenylyltransferase
MSSVLGIITSSGNQIRVEGLQDYRPIGAFSFLGRYRVIDFPVSNFSNSGMDRIQVYVGQNPRSLAEHLGNERVYNINPKRGKLQLLFNQDSRVNDIYNTDVAAYMENIKVIERAPQEYVVITPGYMIFKQNFYELLKTHIESGADVTLLYQKVENAKESYRNCSTLELNRQKGVTAIARNLGTAKEKNIFMDTVVMKRELFIDLLRKAVKTSAICSLTDILNIENPNLDIRGVQHKGYFAAITDFRSYYDANMELLNYDVSSQLISSAWPIYTVTTDSCPVHYYETASVRNSMVANGCMIAGTVENSVIGRDVKIEEGAVVKNCVILGHTTIKKNVHLTCQVVDKWAQVIHAGDLTATPDAPGYIRRDDVI